MINALVEFSRNIQSKFTKKSEDSADVYAGQLALDIYEEDTLITIVAPVAGIKKEDIDIQYHDGVLTVKGKRAKRKSFSLKNYVAQECFWGAFSRSVVLPTGIIPSKIHASFKDAILTITIEKEPSDSTKKIEISS